MYKIEKFYKKSKSKVVMIFCVIDIYSSKLVKGFNDYDEAEKYIFKLLGENHDL